MKAALLGIPIFVILFGMVVGESFAQTVSLLPTDDTMIIINTLDIEDNQGLTNLNTGNFNYLRIGYDQDSTDARPLYVPFLKFDLKDYTAEQIESAILKMDLSHEKKLPYGAASVTVFLSYDSNWNESELTYSNAPKWDTAQAEVRMWKRGMQEWDITQAAKQFAGEDLSIVLYFTTPLSVRVGEINFPSKESDLTKPVLEIKLNDPAFEGDSPLKLTQPKTSIIIPESIGSPDELTQESGILKLKPTDDTFVIKNLNDEGTFDNLLTSNFGNEETIIVYYSNNTTEFNESIVAPAYMKFNLANLNADILSAQLKMFAEKSELENIEKIINVYPVDDNNWNESEIIYLNKPDYSETPISQTTITDELNWYSWDLTDYVKDNLGREMSLVINFDDTSGQKEQVNFHSTETAQEALMPYLEIEYSTEN